MNSKMNALRIMDVMINALSRDGPGRGEFVPKAKDASLFREFAPFVGLTKSSYGWKSDSPSFYNALYFSRGFYEVLLDYSSKLMRLPLGDQLLIFNMAKEWPTNKFIKFAKYATVYPMARFLRNKLPDTPEGFNQNPLWGGKIKRFLKARLMSNSKKNSSLFFGILQGVKRACAQVDETFVHETMLKHKSALTSPPRGSPVEELRPYYIDFFSRYKMSPVKLYEASTAASFESTRAEGGSRSFIMKDLDKGLIKMYEYRPGDVKQISGPILPDLNEVLEKSMNSTNDVMVEAVLEPLKVRLITKGSSYRYWLSRWIQKDMWRYLQRYPQFALTGEPLRPEHLHKLLDREKKLDIDWMFDLWVSGDYASATDALDIRHTKAAFEAALNQGLFDLDPRIRDILRSVLYEQRINYPKTQNKNGDLDTVDQTTGQLMGSTLSFPILCTVNLVAYWKALEEYLGVEIDNPRDLPVLINGDDILFRANKRLYKIWKKWIKAVGFELSLGKNYIHPNYLTVNSQLYHFKDGEFEKIRYLNPGLLTGQSKITGRENARVAPIWDYYNEVVGSALDQARAHKRFLHYNKDLINEISFKGLYNLGIPFLRGGLGFHIPTDVKLRVTPFQRRLATFLQKKFFEGSPETHKILGSRRSPLQPTYFHLPRYVVQPLYGPYEEDIVILKDRIVSLPPMAVMLDVSEPEMVWRPLSTKLLKEFRASTWRQMGGQVFQFPFRLMERVILFPSGSA
jgi:hypothetical protein